MVAQSIIVDIDAFLKRHEMAESTFGRLAINDWKLVRSLRAGSRRIWPETEAKVRAFMAGYRPSTPTSAAEAA